ncbi:MAG: MEKHLA domain-containing protein [Symploca sp. SIO1A3]|nr:MEKHLA domain-containing protein [Symploca sp. SIO1A3]
MDNPPWQQESVIKQSQLILNSFEVWSKHDLFNKPGLLDIKKGLLNIKNSPQNVAQQLFEAPFIVVSHGTESNPILNYGNQKALDIWELSWQNFTKTPSRDTAEAIEQVERDRLLAETSKQGFCEFSVIRITSTGKRFKINQGVVWNLINEQQVYQGQAAVYSDFYFL